MSFVIPRAAVPAAVRLVDATDQAGQIFVMERVAHHDGPETPLEMLNRAEGFFPFRPARAPEREVLLISKANTVSVSVDHDTVEFDPDRLMAAQEIRLSVTLRGGETLRGRVYTELPAHAARLLDYLNTTTAPFFFMVTDDATVYLNRVHVLAARPLD